MKKHLLMVGVLASSALLAQVGINQESPRATLEVKTKEADLNGTTNEGIIAPQLTKDRVAKIETPVEGTLVYVTDAVYTGNNDKVSEITEKGYYFYNGTKWVKSQANNITAGNGLTKQGDKIELGGILEKHTELNLNHKFFNISYGKMFASGGGFTINNSTRIDKYKAWSGLDIVQYGEPDETYGYSTVNLVSGDANHRKTEGREVKFSPQGRILGGVHGYDAKSFLAENYNYTGASLQFIAAEQFTETAKGTSLRLNVIPKGTIIRKGIMFLDSEGNVGINEPNPTQKLDITGGNIQIKNNGNSPRIIIDAEADKYAITRYSRDNKVRWDTGLSNDAETGDNEGSNYYIHSFNDDASFKGRVFTIKRKDGNVGIGTSSPTQKLEVNGKVKAANVIFTGIKEYNDNQAAKSAGLQVGEMYRTGDLIKIVH